MEAEKFMKTLPAHLRSELDLEINREIISRIPYFKEKSESFWAAATPHLKSSKVYMGEYIFLKGEPIYEIYFLLSGSAGYTLSEDNITYIFWEIHPGNVFGELDFFTCNADVPTGKRQFNAKAIEDCEIITMSKESIYELERLAPKAIAEIFEYANFRLKKLINAKHKGEIEIRQKKQKEMFNDGEGKLVISSHVPIMDFFEGLSEVREKESDSSDDR
jgi:CRP-like cAMP-binding protein